MARQKRDGETEPAAEVRAADDGQTLELVGEPAEPTKKIKFTAFKVFTSRGRRLADDVDDFPVTEADKLIADGVAVECT
jgi:hypothetical protein